MTDKTAKGPVTVSNTAELRTALVAGYTADEIVMPDTSAQLTQARSEGVTAGRAESKALIDTARAEGLAAGRTEELNRIKSVEQACLPGHESLIQSLKFDGKTTGAEAAAQVITAERANRGRRLEDLAVDGGKAIVPHTAAPPASADTDKDKPKVDPTLPIEDRCKAEWQHDPELRKEFSNDLDSYISYAKAHEGGRMKVLRDRTAKG
jgi:hypothetical protein